jgi:SAM-dependent methyltransferase
VTRRCFACAHAPLDTLPDVPDLHVRPGAAYTLLRCPACGTAALATPPSAAELDAIYPPQYYSYVNDGSRIRFLRWVHRLTYDRHRFKPNFRRLLEVGCGRGEFLSTIARRGEVTGLERSAAARAAAAKRGVDVIVGDVRDGETFAPGSFDYIYSNHAFEHLEEPRLALASIRRWLTPGGRVFIGVPNVRGAVARYFGKYWYHLAPPLHASGFSPAGITSLLTEFGFTVERIRYNSDPLSIPMSAFFARGGHATRISLLAGIALAAANFLVYPLARIFDAAGDGDCIEVHARLRDG